MGNIHNALIFETLPLAAGPQHHLLELPRPELVGADLLGRRSLDEGGGLDWHQEGVSDHQGQRGPGRLRRGAPGDRLTVGPGVGGAGLQWTKILDNFRKENKTKCFRLLHFDSACSE